MSIHDGHRTRLRERYLQEGLDHFDEHQVLELLLFYCIPRKDTNEIACNLMKRFGSFSAVMTAPVSELKKVPGVGASAATFFALLRDVDRYYKTHQETNPQFMNQKKDYGDFLRDVLAHQRNEKASVCCILPEAEANCMTLVLRAEDDGLSSEYRLLYEKKTWTPVPKGLNM